MHVTCTPPGLYIVDLYTFYPLFFLPHSRRVEFDGMLTNVLF